MGRGCPPSLPRALRCSHGRKPELRALWPTRPVLGVRRASVTQERLWGGSVLSEGYRWSSPALCNSQRPRRPCYFIFVRAQIPGFPIGARSHAGCTLHTSASLPSCRAPARVARRFLAIQRGTKEAVPASGLSVRYPTLWWALGSIASRRTERPLQNWWSRAPAEREPKVRAVALFPGFRAYLARSCAWPGRTDGSIAMARRPRNISFHSTSLVKGSRPH